MREARAIAAGCSKRVQERAIKLKHIIHVIMVIGGQPGEGGRVLRKVRSVEISREEVRAANGNSQERSRAGYDAHLSRRPRGITGKPVAGLRRRRSKATHDGGQLTGDPITKLRRANGRS